MDGGRAAAGGAAAAGHSGLSGVRGARRAAAVVAVAIAASAAAADLTGAGTRGAPGTGARARLAGTPAAGQVAASASGPGLRRVSYRGYTFAVPHGWAVIDERARPTACVRFDQHAIYLGSVSPREFCPSWLIGTTEAMLVQPGPAAARPAAVLDAVARQVVVQAPGVRITATYDTNLALIERVLRGASLPVPGAGNGVAATRGAATEPWAAAAIASASGASARAVPPLPATVASYQGLGFDACAAPSSSYMTAWRRRSPYRAIGIYIGGADRACAQPNLTPSWVRQQAAAGWRFIPLYVGPQAEFGEVRAPVWQGTAAARDAAAQARRLGFGPRTPIYYDMEAYRPRWRGTVLRLLSAWTTELHRLGYLSGAYSSSDSGVADLAASYFSRAYAMPGIIYDALWNGVRSTADRHFRPGEWAHHQRIHQFRGNVTREYGGDRINVDLDVLDVRITSATATIQPSQAVALPGQAADLFYRARGGMLMFAQFRPGSGWGRPRRTGLVARSAPSVVRTGSLVDVVYQGGSGRIWAASFRPGGTLVSRSRLTALGIAGSAPRAVARGGVIDVFWRGSADDHLWHGEYAPGDGWSGPQDLGGSLASPPSPVVAGSGRIDVFWKGRDASLWYTASASGARWSAPASLGMGPLGGPPMATAQPDGAVQVCWAGSGNPHVWEGFYQPGRGWRGPRDLGGVLRSAPWPVTAGGVARVLWLGPGHALDGIEHRPGGEWNRSGWRVQPSLRGAWVAAAPFAAAGGRGQVLRAFWQGRGGWLWAAALASDRWSAPRRLAATPPRRGQR